MEEFAVYGVFGTYGPPQRLLGAKGASRASVAVPASVRQVVLFSSGPWEERICVNAELNDAELVPITIGKLTPYNKCLSWEQWEEETWTDRVTLTVTLEGGSPSKAEPEVILAVKEYTPKGVLMPLATQEVGKKRKRGRSSEQEKDESGKSVAKAGEENVCVNSVQEKTTPIRKVKGQPKGSQKLFSNQPDSSTGKAEVNGLGEVQQGVGRTPPPSASKTKNRQAKTPTQTASPLGPSARWGQTLCPIDAQTAILIGGQGAKMQFCKDPMWKLCTEDLSWVTAETLAEGPTPETRIGHTAIYDPESRRIFVFGGSKNRKWFNDVHILDTQTWRWSMVEAQGKVPPLAYHSCSLFRGELFVLGGVSPCPHPKPDACSDSLYIFDPQLSIWYQPIVTGNKPSPRSGHSACVMQERYIYVFGGWDTPICYGDMYMLDLGLMEFSAVQTSGKTPSPRSWHGSAVLSDTKFLIHGGYNGNDSLSDAFIFDTDTKSWTEVTLPQLPLPRAGHSIVAMATASRHGFPGKEQDRGTSLLVFGGGDNEGSFYCDLTSVAVEDLL